MKPRPFGAIGRGSWAAAAMAGFALTLRPLSAESIAWSAPEDGGTPRATNRIERAGPREFRIRASFEEGGRSVLRHAISRVDLFCHNDGTQAVPVTVRLELSGDGRRTDYDNKPEAGMRLRDFVFIQPPGEDWRQVDGSTERWVAQVQFTARPGLTKLGLSPWYTYGDYQQFIGGLPASPQLKKEMIGRSDGGREHWELTITDPTVPAEQKRTIFWQAREHAYETYSSFAMEGLVEFLLSEGAAEFRRRYVIVLHPMTNVDGVAEGFEYRGGYDFPDPRGTATGRLTFAAIDRLRPDFAVAWHNWVAPRDRNVVFYTDGDNGQPTARAWLRFTQLFPSLHGAGHRWKDETTPLKYNWEGRRPLSEANVHQYAMKKFGTRVWGWEMPWWNCTVAEVRRSGAGFARAFLTTLEELRTRSEPLETEAAEVETPCRGMHEFSVRARARVDNPFRDGALVGEFISPSGRTNVLDGFYDGGDIWRLRFAPEEEGEWRYLLRGEGIELLHSDRVEPSRSERVERPGGGERSELQRSARVELVQRGRLRCTAARGHGVIRVHPENPYAFAHADGTPFFPLGDTCYGLYDDSPITPARRGEYLRTRGSQRFNFVRMQVSQSRPHGAQDPAFWPWGGSVREPDLDRLNPVFFQGLDELFRQARAGGMNFELILLNFYQPPMNDPGQWTPARERLWLRYLVARYAAFDNLFLWTLANEYETRPDGKYRLDAPGDVEWAKAAARWVKTNDPLRHLVTVHPVVSASRRGESPRAPIDPPWRIGEFFGEDDAMDVLSQQTGSSGDGVAWDEARQCWTGDASTLVASVQADRRYGKPVLNSESGYEYLRGQPTEKKQVHHTDKVRRSAWRVVCAGGYVAAGFNGTIGHNDVWNLLDAPNRYTFVVKDEGAAAQLGALHDFFVALPFWRLQPWAGVAGLAGDAVALAEAGRVYVVYFPHGRGATLDLTGQAREFSGRWFNPRSGKFEGSFRRRGGGVWRVDAPDPQDWVLRLDARP